jgi:MEMO1 family protein
MLLLRLNRNKTNIYSKRVFLLGPSHHVYLDTCALSAQLTYETPCGDLKTCASTIGELRRTGAFTEMSKKTDEEEHSLEMHLPYIYKMLQL